MPPLAHAALAASIVLSALGAVIVCLLIVAYGFTPSGEETPLRATRRLFVTRMGHAAAAACFAGTAILLAVVLAQLVHHGNEHRTQATTILGSHGIDPPEISGWAYGRAVGISDHD